MQQKICMALEPEGFLKHSTASPICCEKNSQCYTFDVFLLKSDKCCKVGKVTQLHTCTCRALIFQYLTTGWADELVKLRVDLTAPLKKSILDVIVEQLSLGKQPPPVKFMLKHKCWKRSKGPQTPYRSFSLKTSVRATVTEGSPAQVAQLQCSGSRPLFKLPVIPREE